MNLRTVDLNLLVAFEALVSAQHVTHAARRLGLSQPATSNALRRLRVVFGDELLVRTPGGMRPTPRALELLEPVRAVLRQVERVLEPAGAFDPRTAERRFRVRLSDVLSVLVLPALLRSFAPARGRLALDVVHLAPDETVDALERDEVDVAVSFGLVHGSTVLAEAALADRMVCAVRRGHPFLPGGPDLAAFLAAEHVRVAMSPTDLRFVDDALRAGGHARRVALNVPHWLVVPHALAGGDLVSVMPERLFRALADPRLGLCELPFPSPAFAWSLYWHRRQDRDPAIRWLRDALRRALA